jgi:hypothetical protein
MGLTYNSTHDIDDPQTTVQRRDLIKSKIFLKKYTKSGTPYLSIKYKILELKKLLKLAPAAGF